MTKAVIIEDDALAAVVLAQLLEGEGFEVRIFHTADDALSAVLESPPEILIADWSVPGDTTTAEVAKMLKIVSPEAKIIFISGYESSELRALESSSGAEVVAKPLHYERFISDIRSYGRQASSAHL